MNVNFLIAPSTPYLLLSLAGALLAMLGLSIGERRPLTALAGLGGKLNPVGLMVGQVGGVAAASLLLLVAVAGGEQGQLRTLLILAAVGAYLALAVVLPRRGERRRAREAVALRRLTPGLIAFVRVAMGSFEAPVEIMRRYTARPSARLAPMQALVAEAIQTGADLRLRPFAALSLAARARGCRELSDVAEALAQAEAEGGRVDAVLAAQQETLELILQGEFKRMVRRRTMYLLLMVAVSLVVGILGNLLFIMTSGGGALARLG